MGPAWFQALPKARRPKEPIPSHLKYGKRTGEYVNRRDGSILLWVPRGTATIGIGTPGSWHSGRGAMQNCNSTWLNDRPLLTDLQDRLDNRVRIANDADCFARSEAEAEPAAEGGDRILFGVILGTGVGGGIVVDGRLLEGCNGLAGKWGHTPLPYLRYDSADPTCELETRLESRHCYCGRLDCLETFLSGPGLARTHHSLWGERLSAEEISEAAQGLPSGSLGQQHAQATLALFEVMLARSLAQIVNVVDPHTIVLGGGLSNIARLYHTLLPRMRDFVFSADCRTVIRAPVWGDSSGVRGAAWLWDDAEGLDSPAD